MAEHLEWLAPPNCEEGRYHHRGNSVYKYVRTTVFNDIRKFYEALDSVTSAQLSGVSIQQMVNIAVAVHTGRCCDSLDYIAFKDYDPNNWRNYLAWLELLSLPQFKYKNPIATALANQRPPLERMTIREDESQEVLSSVTLDQEILNISMSTTVNDKKRKREEIIRHEADSQHDEAREEREITQLGLMKKKNDGSVQAIFAHRKKVAEHLYSVGSDSLMQW